MPKNIIIVLVGSKPHTGIPKHFYLAKTQNMNMKSIQGKVKFVRLTSCRMNNLPKKLRNVVVALSLA